MYKSNGEYLKNRGHRIWMDRIDVLSTNVYMIYYRIVLCFLFFCKYVYGLLKTPE